MCADQRRAGDILFALGKGCDQPWGAQPQRGIAQQFGALGRRDDLRKAGQPGKGGIDLFPARVGRQGAEQVDQLPQLDTLQRRAVGAQAQELLEKLK